MDGEKGDAKYYLEIWCETNLMDCIDLTDSSGEIYNDGNTLFFIFILNYYIYYIYYIYIIIFNTFIIYNLLIMFIMIDRFMDSLLK